MENVIDYLFILYQNKVIKMFKLILIENNHIFLKYQKIQLKNFIFATFELFLTKNH